MADVGVVLAEVDVILDEVGLVKFEEVRVVTDDDNEVNFSVVDFWEETPLVREVTSAIGVVVGVVVGVVRGVVNVEGEPVVVVVVVDVRGNIFGPVVIYLTCY